MLVQFAFHSPILEENYNKNTQCYEGSLGGAVKDYQQLFINIKAI